MPVRGSVLNSGPPPICEMGDHVTLAQAIESALDAAGPEGSSGPRSSRASGSPPNICGRWRPRRDPAMAKVR